MSKLTSRSIAFVLAAALSGSIPALAATGDGAPPPAAKAPEQPKKICRVLENTTGSHMAGNGRTCMTAEKWAIRDSRQRNRGSGAAPVDQRSADKD